MEPTRSPEDLERRLQNVTEKLLSVFEELDFVHTLAEILTRPEGIADLEGYLLRETIDIFKADGGWIARRGPEGRLETAATEGMSPAIPEFLTQSLIESLVARGALPYLVDDLPSALIREIRETDRKTRLVARTKTKEFPHAFLAVPIEANDEILGAICLGKTRTGDPFTAGDLKLLATLAHQAALFMRNADLVARLQAEARSLGRRVEQLESSDRKKPDISWIRGPSAAMRKLAKQIEGAATTDATILLLGESGTGKSLAARILHELSERRSGPFVEVNCGAIPVTLIESELFGHTRGAFTGADRDRAGLFEEAGGGAVFLDEVAELPAESQVKLLAVLEGKRIRRIGENRDRPVHARVLAATNADLAGAVREGRFREDLYYRLNVLTLVVPPLRERIEDILPLAQRFLEALSKETNRRVHGFAPKAEEALIAYRWPGNVRELRNVVERSLLLKAHGDRIEPEDLPFTKATAPGLAHDSSAPLPGAVRDFEKRIILEALEASGGVVARAAILLGISRTNLHNKLAKHGLLKRSQWR